MDKGRRVRFVSWISEKKRSAEPGRAWAALFGSVMTFFLFYIPNATYGILFEDITNEFEASKKGVSWALAIHWQCIFATGLCMSPIIKIYGCKWTQFVGSMIFSAGMSLASLSTGLTTFCVFYGVIAGIGAGVLFLTAPTVVQQHFTENRGLATGMATFGLSLGAMIHPPLCRFLLDQFALKGTLLILGGLCLHGTLLSFVMESPTKYKTQRKKNKDGNETKSVSTSGSEIKTEDISVVNNGHVIGKEENFVFTIENKSNRCQSEPGSVSASKKTNALKNYFQGMLDFAPLKQPCYVLCVMHYFLGWMSKFGMLVHYVTCARRRGISVSDAAYLMSINGLGSVIALLVSPLLMNLSWMDPVWLLSISASLVSISAFGAAYSHSYELLATFAFTLGVGDAVAFSSVPLLVVQLLGVEAFARGMSILWTLIIAAPMGASPLVGWLADNYGNYVVAFDLMGVEAAVAALLTLVIVKMRRKDRKSNQPKTPSDVSVSKETI